MTHRLDPQFGPIVLLGFGGVYAETLQDVIGEVDINPIIVHESECTIVDALVVAN